MKKFSIITLTNNVWCYNYGNCLQNFALDLFLRNTYNNKIIIKTIFARDIEHALKNFFREAIYKIFNICILKKKIKL